MNEQSLRQFFDLGERACPDCGGRLTPTHHEKSEVHQGRAISECESNRISKDGP